MDLLSLPLAGSAGMRGAHPGVVSGLQGDRPRSRKGAGSGTGGCQGLPGMLSSTLPTLEWRPDQAALASLYPW